MVENLKARLSETLKIGDFSVRFIAMNDHGVKAVVSDSQFPNKYRVVELQWLEPLRLHGPLVVQPIAVYRKRIIYNVFGDSP